MKLYIWRNVLTDYAPGIAFALAESADAARNLLYAKSGDNPDDVAADRTIWGQDLHVEPEEHPIEPFCDYMWGSS